MKKIIDIKAINLEKLNSAEYAQFIERVINLVTKATPEKLFIEEDLVTALQKKLETLTEIIGQSYASQETKKLADTDKERNKLAVFLLSSFRLERNNIDEKRKESATILHDLSKHYKGLQYLPVRQKTQFISAMLNDLTKSENKAHINVLGLSKTVNALETKNQEYQKLSEGRSESQLANTFVSFKQIKKETNALYRDLIKYAFAGNLLHESPESLNFVNLINKLITDTMNANKQRLSSSSTSKNSGMPKEDKTMPDIR